MKKLTVSLFAVVLSLVLLGCSKNPSGLYECNTVSFDVPLHRTLDIRSDGTCYHKNAFQDNPERCTWTQSGKTITVSHENGHTGTFTVEGSDLLEMDATHPLRYVRK